MINNVKFMKRVSLFFGILLTLFAFNACNNQQISNEDEIYVDPAIDKTY